MCGIFGIANHDDSARMSYLGLYALQHRGQESAGISSTDGTKLFTAKAMGHVGDIFTTEIVDSLKGSNAIGHTRYSTSNDKDGDAAKQNIQPIYVKCAFGEIAIGHNGNLTNAETLRRDLEKQGAIFHSTTDTEVFLHLLARQDGSDIVAALKAVCRQVEGAYSLVILTKECLIALRDPFGYRPLAMGQVDDAYVFASETCAFDLINATYKREIEPGEMFVVERGVPQSCRLQDPEPLPAQDAQQVTKKCVFEHVYFSRPDSVVFGRSVSKSRAQMGRFLAQDSPVDADLVVPVPDSGLQAALGFAQESGIPFAFGITRNHYVGRTFIEPRSGIRNFGVKVKLNPDRDVLAGKRVILIDDSIVRGTTSRKIVRMVRDAGEATEVHMRISCPPTVSSCHWGIDTPDKGKLIASSHSVEEIRQYIEANSLAYLREERMLEAVEAKPNEYCKACFQP